MNRKAQINFFGEHVGFLWEDEHGFHFHYLSVYVEASEQCPISHSLPVQVEPFESQQLFSFFDGLIPEGWLLNLATESWKINPRDRMGLLLTCCKECIGAVSVISLDNVS
jgi:serine/threonine-protein kinase HipA